MLSYPQQVIRHIKTQANMAHSKKENKSPDIVPKETWVSDLT